MQGQLGALSCLLAILFFLWPSLPSPEGIVSAFSFFSTFLHSLALVPLVITWVIPIPGHSDALHDLLVKGERSQQYIRPKPEGHMVTLAVRNHDASTGEDQIILCCVVEKRPQTGLVSGKLPLGWSEGQLCSGRLGTMKHLRQSKSCKTTGMLCY